MRILVAGIGNVFLGDDGFGVEVVRRLGEQPPETAIDVRDFGIRGLHLAFALSDGRYDAAIVVDATSRGGAPGTLYAIEPDPDSPAREAVVPDAHGLTPDAVLAWIQHVGGVRPKRIIVVGCEPAVLEESMGLSEPVAAAVDGAIAMVRDFIVELSGVARCA